MITNKIDIKWTEVIITDVENIFQSGYDGVMEMPTDLKEELLANGILPVFMALPSSNQNYYISWVEGTKNIDARHSRIVKTCELVADKI